MSFSAIEHEHMARALQLAMRGVQTVTPNPAVGCVIAKGDAVLGEGFHERAGQPHAEVNALRQAGERAAGATAFVTLEPCSTHGRTPPCADALIAAGIARVVFAMADPNPAVSGNGAAQLRSAGVEVAIGLMADAAAAVNPGYCQRMGSGRPRVTLKIASSLDGATAMRSGESQWITSPAARADVQQMRARACAILTGVGTVLADDPSLTVRLRSGASAARQPLRVVVDSQLRTPPTSRMLTLDGDTLIVTTSDQVPAALGALSAVEQVASDDSGQVDLSAAIAALAARGVNEVLVEAGATLCGALLSEGLVDRIVIYMAPKLLGSETRGLFATPNWLTLANGQTLRITDLRRVGPDMRITAAVGATQ
ncbi:MAG: bifunctional diaminohydroxyphosphoribosylaminopyrimidine deaminase/5-amino-6-(5-phosphoribosylamino)uracil reductase RibD [Pseudomonadota bacterium]